VGEIHDCIDAVLGGREFLLPRFDFQRGRRAEERVPLSLPENGTLILEGLHALNPRLSAGVANEGLFRLFISVSTNILDEDGSRILSGRRVRFLRRVIRDHQHRNADAARTYALWLDVVAGEEKHLYPFRDTADCQIDTFHAYEIGVLRGFAEPLLAAANAPKNAYVAGILQALAHFSPIPRAAVPSTSLLSEFIPAEG
jgi:uridine kinase